VAEAGDAVALRGRLRRTDPLTSIERVELIVVAGLVPHINRPPTVVDDGVSRTHETGGPIRVDDVGVWNQLNQSTYDGVGRRGPLFVAQHHAVHVEALTLPQSLEGGEEEAPSWNDRSSQ